MALAILGPNTPMMLKIKSKESPVGNRSFPRIKAVIGERREKYDPQNRPKTKLNPSKAA